MTRRKLHNYLRTHRKRSGLSQDEVAFLLGMSGGDKICRHERRKKVPSLETVLAYEAIYGTPAQELFAGLREKVEQETKRRAKTLARRLEREPAGPWRDRKLAHLRGLAAASYHHEESTTIA